jgi:hypothetical protein
MRRMAKDVTRQHAGRWCSHLGLGGALARSYDMLIPADKLPAARTAGRSSR